MFVYICGENYLVNNFNDVNYACDWTFAVSVIFPVFKWCKFDYQIKVICDCYSK